MIIAVKTWDERRRTEVRLERDGLDALASAAIVDSYIVSAEDGLSPLGASRAFLAADLGIEEAELTGLAGRIQADNERVTLVAVPSRRPASRLRGVVLAPGETPKSYERFATPNHGRPYRDFYYNVTYEALSVVLRKWGSRRPAISHLTASQHFDSVVATCSLEALAHLCEKADVAFDSLTFQGCCIEVEHLRSVPERIGQESGDKHRPIRLEAEMVRGATLLHLDWAVRP